MIFHVGYASHIVFFLLWTAYVAQSRVIYGPNAKPYRQELETLHDCVLSLDIVTLIDISESEQDKMGTIKRELAAGMASIREYFPETRFSIASFVDKPIEPLGYGLTTWIDSCLQLHTTFEQSLSDHTSALEGLYAAGGYDFPEAQLDALFRAALTSRLHWKTPESVEEDGLPYYKLLLLVTDSFYHVQGDAKRAMDALHRDSLRPHDVDVYPTRLDARPDLLDSDPNAHCGDFDYPSVQQLGDVLKKNNFFPVFLVAPAGYPCNPDSKDICPYMEQKELAKKYNNNEYADPFQGMELRYANLLQEMGITGILERLGTAFQGFEKKLLEALAQLGKLPQKCTKSSKVPKEVTTPTPTPQPTTEGIVPTVSETIIPTVSETIIPTVPDMTEPTATETPTATDMAALTVTDTTVPPTEDITLPYPSGQSCCGFECEPLKVKVSVEITT